MGRDIAIERSPLWKGIINAAQCPITRLAEVRYTRSVRINTVSPSVPDRNDGIPVTDHHRPTVGERRARRPKGHV